MSHNHVLNLVCAGTIKLGYNGTHRIRQYVPSADEPDEDGLVTESAVIMFVESSPVTAHSDMQNVDTYLRVHAPAWYNYRAGTAVYVHYDPDNSGTIYRSLIKEGKVVPSQDTFNWQWNNNVAEAQVTWRRRPYWEGPEVTLVSGSAIYNCPGSVNYVDVAGTAVGGAIPAPFRLELQNGHGTGNYNDAYWVGLNRWHSPASLNPWKEAESASGGSAVASATASGGSINRITLTDTEASLLTWAIDPAAYGGGYYRALLRFDAELTGTTYMRLRISQSGTTLWEQAAPTTLDITSRIQDLGAIQLPPLLGGLADVGNVSLTLRGYGSDTSMDLDYLALLPMDGFRQYNAVVDLNGLDFLVDDGIEERLYVTDSSLENATADWTATGKRPELTPGISQRLHFVARKNDGTSSIDRHSHVTIKHRPRKAIL